MTTPTNDYEERKKFIKHLHEFVKKQILAGLYKSNIIEQLEDLGVERLDAHELIERMEEHLRPKRKKKILVVEDEKHSRELLAEILKKHGYKVFPAEDGEEGFSVYEKVKPDLVLTDVLMPKMKGHELIAKLRKTFWVYPIPFIVLTERGLMKEYFESLEVDAFIDKPFHTDDLLDKIKKALSKIPF